MSVKTDVLVVGGVALGLVAMAWYAKKTISDAGTAIWDTGTQIIDGAGQVVMQTVPYINPADDRNVVYTGVNSIGGKIAGNPNWNLGSWLYDITH